ncbi:MAG: flagellar basal body L-ring protein FlgH [Phycisphaerae bacterium]|nr:flagellar basal body L-ring protein FlgH [Phycisphaerae bacterium]
MKKLISILVIFTLAANVYADQNNSLHAKAEQKIEEKRAMELNKNVNHRLTNNIKQDNDEAPDFPIIKGSKTPETTAARKASWIAVEKPEPREIQVHDLVSIRINEISSHKTKADTKTEREYEIDYSLKDWIKLTNGNLGVDAQGSGDPKIAAALNTEFEGKGDISRTDSLKANIMAEVMDVMPNGNLALMATHTIVTDEETTVITLTGQCRSQDVKYDNTVLSTEIAYLKVEKKHSGAARDATKRSLLQKLLGFLNIF